MNNIKPELERVHKQYSSRVFRGVNELFHLELRKQLILRASGKKAIEIGCGLGDWTRKLCKLYDQLDVVEGSSSLIKNISKICHKDMAKINIHNITIEDFSPEGTWDDAFLTFLLEHSDNPVKVLKKISSLLGEHGRLFIAVPNADSLHRVLAKRMGLIKSTSELSKHDLEIGHKRVYTEKLLRGQIAKAGFEVMEMFFVGLKPLNLEQMNLLDSNLVDVMAKSGDLAKNHCAYIGIIAKKKKSKR